jgi:3-oxoacyl-[acyl-carrier protein] reductase
MTTLPTEAATTAWRLAFAELANQKVLITGGSTGIGAAVARGFGACGASVGIVYNSSAEQAHQVADDVRRLGGHATVIQADLAQAGCARGLVEEAVNQMGGLDILINNAGSILGRRPTLEVDDDFYRRIMELNLNSTFTACQAALKIFSRQGRGTIINTTSLAARMGGGPGTVAYASAKAGVSTMTRGLAREYGALGIRVNAVSPGFIVTPLHDRFTEPAMMETFAKTVPLCRLGVPDDCVGTYLFLASPTLAGYITGQTIEVNGGILMP